MKNKEVESNKKDIYTQHLLDAYKWYDKLKSKENKTSDDITNLIIIEERHKMSILEMYGKALNKFNNDVKLLQNEK